MGLATAITQAHATSPIPAPLQRTLSELCIDCHDATEKKGDVNLDQTAIDWNEPTQQDLWLRAFVAIEQGLMPPPKKKQPTSGEKQALLAHLEKSLLNQIHIGTTAPRRLNQKEYTATVRSLFHLPSFTLPSGFPTDGESHGFDNLSDGLTLSPAHLEAYRTVATEIADEIFPSKRAQSKPMTWEAGPEDMVLSFAAATVHGDALRLVSRSVDVFRSCTWPSRIEIKDSGTYRVEVDASKFLTEAGHPFDKPMILEVRARNVTASDRSNVTAFRLLKEISVSSDSSEKSVFEADLYEGETLVFRWANAEMTHEFQELAELYRNWFEKDPRFLAAWQKAIFPAGDLRPAVTRLRGRNGWDIVSKHWTDPNLDLSQATMESKATLKVLEIANSFTGTSSIADALCHFYHERGPALELHHVTIGGPLKSIESPRDLARTKARTLLTGIRREGQSPEAFGEEVVRRLLPKAFRRDVQEDTIHSYTTLFKDHLKDSHSFEEAMHLVVRNILISPRFLYHGVEGAKDDEYNLANRLSYFLTQGPPDAKLTNLAKAHNLSKGTQLRSEAQRLLPKQFTDPMIQSFVGQWLRTRKLSSIMPDPRFGFDDSSIAMARRETERFFTEMLTLNLPMTDFIDPNFTFSSPEFMTRIYGTPKEGGAAKKSAPSNKPTVQFEKIPIERGGRYGGLLGQSAILMATANGVDTQPVIRGVWVLENILGTPPPPPPKNVPALTPDTQGSISPRALLAAHTKDSACAGCHQRIDPIGLALENYDPVGRWRTVWPGTKINIDPSCVLTDGTAIKDPRDFKAWLVKNIDQFSQCVAEKLMTYATGRVPNFAEKREIRGIVLANHAKGNGFRDLVLDLIESETFRSQ
ncbi:MAG: DUF1588 domain-containing protein [Verrucomicrobiota bacterium]